MIDKIEELTLELKPLENLHQYYLDACAAYQSPICANISIVLETRAHHLEIPESFTMAHMLPLGAVLKRDKNILSIDFAKYNTRK